MKKEIKNLKKSLLMAGLCSAVFFAPVQNVRAEAFTAEQKTELEALFKTFLADNPEAILKSVDDYRTAQEIKSQQSAEETLKNYQGYFSGSGLPMAGNPHGDVTVVEYFDYNCGYCRKAFADIQTILKEDNNLRVVFQEMPILSPSSKKMAAFAMAAHNQGKYFEMHTALMDYKGSQSDDAYIKLAEKLGLDVVKLKEDVAGDDIAKAIEESSGMANALGIRGTPGFIIGERIYPGYIGLDGLRKAIEGARSAQKKNTE